MPKTSLITYDTAFMMASAVGEAGVADKDLPELHGGLERVRARLVAQRKDRSATFFAIPDLSKELRDAMRLASSLAGKHRDLVVIGIGGSDLGARAILRALGPSGKGMNVHFIGANTDPEEIAALLDHVDLKKAVLNIVSKSGDTIEPMSTFLLLRDRLIRKVGKKAHAARVVATTDAKKGTLRKIADREGYATLPVPDGIGGRFSALTPVGLFPAACAGIDARGLVAGASSVFDDAGAPVKENGPLLFAGLHHDGYVRRGQRITVLMPYADGLKEMGAWFRQLWAESLGKRLSRSGEVVHRGFTPIAALGATDQHSQVQLYNEGPADKIVTLVEVDRFRKDFVVPGPYPDIEGVAYMAGARFSDIIRAERKATALALKKSGRPSGTLHIPSISPGSVGALMAFFMVATAAAAELLDVDAYDQPGVEDGKRAMYALLGRKGYSLDE